MEKIGHEPQNVRELLTETKDVSDLIIDLAYASILYESKDLAKQVRVLENRMDELMYQIRALVAVSVRSFDEAERTTGILQVASAAESISNAAGDLANLVLRDIEIHPVIKEALKEANEKIARVKVGGSSDLQGESLEDLNLPSRFAVWILAVNRGGSWIISPEASKKIEPGDLLLLRGPQDGIDKFCYLADAPEQDWKVGRKYKRLREFIAKMRDSGCSLVDMAFYSVLFKSEEVAEEVRELEERFDELNYEVWREVLKAAKREKDVMNLNSALQMVKSIESISDAADSISDVMLRGVELHPVFAQALEEADEKIARVKVAEGSPLADHTLERLDLWRKRGVYTLVLRRGDRYILNPSREMTVRTGDILIIRGSEKGVGDLIDVASGEKSWEYMG
ncbi:hypothetical protein AKJ64_03995 [candidate division MSBL1 archaeon SCGC-AAA259E17]|uniref:RCK C-terminal domain-containing protein n=1 Tax=candidate division MSBL1 archaeon SCGC-AAA259E17 TaxID=1698263 RepID=A0A133UD64_9EURY|nr:hypothetical protein AKJ64_03995 [candidate division MSBL1 archaeon SCGC-AAA259E17]